MKKKIFWAFLLAGMALSLGACKLFPDDVDTSVSHEEVHIHIYEKHDAATPTCDVAGNAAYYTCKDCDMIFDESQKAIAEIPTIEALGHEYALQKGTEANCCEKGVIDHYTCGVCDKVFDLAKNEITEVEADYDFTNHKSERVILAQAQPTKLTYSAGETFDATGMVVVYKCADCEGEIVDNQFLTFTYQTAEGTAFANGDTKVTVQYNGLSFDVEITVGKEQAQIFGVEEAYETRCGVAPVINATSNLPDSEILISYYDGETEVQPEAFVADTTYTAKVTIAETEAVYGAEVTANVTVKHGFAWASDAENWQKLNYACVCGEVEDFYAMDYQSPYVDADNLEIDLSKFVCGAENVSVKSVQQIVRMIGGGYVAAIEGEKVDIEYTNDGMVYTFAADKYEMPTDEVKPYILTLAVVYEINGVECPIVVEAKLVDKIIKSAYDLLLITYTGDPNSGANEANFGYYVLGNDIDAQGVAWENSNPCWVAAGGFRGIFDGNGYTISNLTASSHGIFGSIGEGAKIQNVTFENVKVNNGAYMFVFCARNAYFTNVDIQFSVDSPSYAIGYSMNNCTFSNVSITTNKTAPAPFLIDENAANAIPETITFNYFISYMVSFNTDGGNEISAVFVAPNATVQEPMTPVKTSEEYDYKFLGWFYNDMAWDFATPITEDITLVAKWEEIKKTPDAPTSNVLLDAKTQMIGKWDYGQEVSVTKDTDATYGDIWKVSINEIAEQSLQHPAVDTKDFAKVYFHIYNPCAKQVRLVIHGGWTAWNAVTIMLEANSWTKVELDVSVFTTDEAGKIFMVLQEPNAASIGGEWKLTSFYGLKADENDAERVEVSLNFGTKTDSGETNEYGKIYNISREQWYIDNNDSKTIGTLQQNKLADALPEGFDHFVFWIYNPTANDLTFHLAGSVGADWKDSADYTTLKAGAWTKVVISNADIQLNKQGQWYVYVENSAAEGWKISTIYAEKAA